MREEHWQQLVMSALVRAMDLRPDGFFTEVPTRDGSRLDLLYVAHGRFIGFELKVAERGQAAATLDSRAVRQLRHFAAVCDQVYLVTIAAPRHYMLSADGTTLVAEPLELQPTPEGVGWAVFDRLALEVVVLTSPAADRTTSPIDRGFVVEHLLGRLGRQQRAIQECRT